MADRGGQPRRQVVPEPMAHHLAPPRDIQGQMKGAPVRVLGILTVRNEGAFLLEWLAHHRAVGFTDFLVFSNDCDDGTDAMLDRLGDLGWLTHICNDGPHAEGPQWAALKAADRHPLMRTADWAMVFDIDEFVNVRVGDGTLGALMAACPGAGGFAMTWRMFGNAGVVAMDDRPVLDSFVRCAPEVLHWPWRAQMVKTLFRNDGAFRKLGVHRPRSLDPDRIDGVVWVDGAGRPLPAGFVRNRVFTDPGSAPYGLVQLNHYALGSMQGYLVKADRGRANREASAFDMGYWVERNFDAAEDRGILRMAGRSAPLLAGLRADPVLGPLHDAALRWRQARFAALMQEEPWRALFGRLMLAPASRVLSADDARLIWQHGARRQGREQTVS